MDLFITDGIAPFCCCFESKVIHWSKPRAPTERDRSLKPIQRTNVVLEH